MIYLDNNATTRPSPGVVEAVRGALEEFWHNPSSVHRPGQAARAQVELARRDVAALVGAKAREVVFTSGGTEAIDLAVRGVLGAGGGRSPRGTPAVVVSTRVEHAAVRDLLEDLEKGGLAQVRWAPVDREGVVDVETLAPLLAGATLASIQWTNNETGAVQPAKKIHELCRAAGVPFHCDGTQWVGKETATGQGHGGAEGRDGADGSSARRSETSPLPCDVLTFSSHKFHGPKGVGVLWARRGVGLHPTIHGTQELGRRGGTENVPGILGAAAAAREASAWLAHAEERARLAGLRDLLEEGVLRAVPGAVVNGPRDVAGAAAGERRRLWNTTNIGFPRLEAEALLLILSEQGVCASAGAACSSGSLDPSPVLLAMGIPPEIAHGSVRFSLSRETTRAEIEEAIEIIVRAAHTLGAGTDGAVPRRQV